MIVLSDVHGNYEALGEVLAKIDEGSRIVSLGDVVGYGPDPEKCLALLTERVAEKDFILGNHEILVTVPSRRDPKYVNPIAITAAEYSEKRLSEGELSRIASWPRYRKESRNYYFVHGAPPSSPWEYLSPDGTSFSEIAQYFREFKPRICFTGHSHKPSLWSIRKGQVDILTDFMEGRPVVLDPGTKYICNVGSVGQPRDGDPRAAFCRVTAAEQTILQLERVKYPLETTQRKIRDAGLPPFLAERLSAGV